MREEPLADNLGDWNSKERVLCYHMHHNDKQRILAAPTLCSQSQG